MIKSKKSIKSIFLKKSDFFTTLHKTMKYLMVIISQERPKK